MRIYVGPTDSLKGEVRAPGSKNYTSRYIWLSALTPGESTVASPALNDDARALIECCRELGAKITEADGLLRIGGFKATEGKAYFESGKRRLDFTSAPGLRFTVAGD